MYHSLSFPTDDLHFPPKGPARSHATLETRPQTLTSLVLRIMRRLHYGRGVPVVASVVAASVHPGGSAAVMFAAMEHLASASGTAAVVSEIRGAAIASASACDSSAVA
jgi:hypothetical protein